MLAEQHHPLPDSAANGNGQPNKPERDRKGRFAPGNRMGRGNPFARQVAALRSRLLKRVTEDDLDTIADTLIARAKIGDLAATKLLFSYVLGKPGEQPDPDRLDIDEWRLLQQGMMTPADMEAFEGSRSMTVQLPFVKADLDKREVLYATVAETYTQDADEEVAYTQELFTEASKLYRDQKPARKPVPELFKVRKEASPPPEQGRTAPSANGGDGPGQEARPAEHQGVPDSLPRAATVSSSNGKRERGVTNSGRAAPSLNGANGRFGGNAVLLENDADSWAELDALLGDDDNDPSLDGGDGGPAGP